MANTIAQKLRIKEGMTLLTLHAPGDFTQGLQGLPPNVSISSSTKKYEQIHWFITNKAQLEKEVEKVVKLVKENVVCWIYYPKGTSKIQTDLTRDKGWEPLLDHTEMQWISLISFDETWSAFGCRLKTEADKKKEVQAKPREIFDYIDPVKKIVRVPDDLAAALKSHKQLNDYFHGLAFSHKKEYVEWIITAKREETRANRIKGTIERLEKGWKNPTNA